MSRIGKQPVAVPADVKVQVANGKVTVEGKKGKLEFSHHPNMIVKHDATAKVLTIARPNDDRQNRALHGLTRTLIANMVDGVTKGFEKRLKIEGLGYSGKIYDQAKDKDTLTKLNVDIAKLTSGKTIVLTVGYANPICLTPPDGVTIEIGDKDGTVIIVKGADKQKVGQLAAEIRGSRKPEPYKGKGIRYENEVIRRKEGKSFASGG